MPMVSKSVVTSRQQTIMGQARVIDDAMRLKSTPHDTDLNPTPATGRGHLGRPPGTKVINGKLVYPERDGTATAPAEIPRPQEKWAIPAGGDVRRTAPAPAVAVAPTIPKRRPGRPTNAEIAARRQAAASNGSVSGVEIEIEVDVPLPSGIARHSPYFEPVKRLTRKGMFFFVPETKKSRSVAAMIRDLSYRLKVKLTIRRDFIHPKTKQIGIGVWRIE